MEGLSRELLRAGSILGLRKVERVLLRTQLWGAGSRHTGSCSEFCWVLFQVDQMSPRQINKVPENTAPHLGQQVGGAWRALQVDTVQYRCPQWTFSVNSRGQPEVAGLTTPQAEGFDCCLLPTKTVYGSEFCLRQLKD